MNLGGAVSSFGSVMAMLALPGSVVSLALWANGLMNSSHRLVYWAALISIPFCYLVYTYTWTGVFIPFFILFSGYLAQQKQSRLALLVAAPVAVLLMVLSIALLL